MLAIIQARFSSTRLPGKVLKKIVGKPMLQLQIERVLRSKKIKHLVVATSRDESDDSIADLCNSIGIDFRRGSLDDVLDRYYTTAKEYDADSIVRITGDCPLIDPEIIDKVINEFNEKSADYASNFHPPTYPDGLDVEVFSFSCLEQAWKNAKLTAEREHVTLFIYQKMQNIKKINILGDEDLSHLRWTVDNKEDFDLINVIYEELYCNENLFSMNHVISFLDKNPGLININSHIIRNEGLQKSLRQNSLFLEVKDS